MRAASIFAKSLRDQRRALIWWSAGIVVLVLSITALYPTYSEAAKELDKMIDQMPPAFRAIFDITGSLSTPEGYLSAEMFSFMAPLLLIVAGVGAGARAVAGEERDGTMETLMSHPVSRRSVAVQKYMAMVVIVGALGAVMAASMMAGVMAFSMDVSLGRIAGATGLTTVLALVFGTLAFGLGTATGRRGLAIGVTSATAVGLYVLKALAEIIDAVEPFGILSPYNVANSSDALRGSVALLPLVVLALVLGAIAAFSTALFDRRDLTW